MPWCSKCKKEYEKGTAYCSICGSELEKDDEGALLVSVSREMDAKIIESKLNAFGIPSLKNYRGIDQIYGSVSYSGIDIFVPTKLLDTAKEILNS